MDTRTVHAHGVMCTTPGQRRGGKKDTTRVQSCPSPHSQGIISDSGLNKAVKAVFPCKPPTNVSQLITCAAQTAQTVGGCVDYIKMLSPVGVVTICIYECHFDENTRL